MVRPDYIAIVHFSIHEVPTQSARGLSEVVIGVFVRLGLLGSVEGPGYIR